MEYGKIVVGAVALIAMVFVPGIALCYAIFPKKGELNVIERLGLGFLFGMAPPLLLYALDKNFGVPMTMVTSFTAIGLFTILGVLGYRIRTSGA